MLRSTLAKRKALHYLTYLSCLDICREKMGDLGQSTSLEQQLSDSVIRQSCCITLLYQGMVSKRREVDVMTRGGSCDATRDGRGAPTPEAGGNGDPKTFSASYVRTSQDRVHAVCLEKLA